MKELSRVVFGAFAALLTLFGLFLAASAGSGAVYEAGLLLALFSVAYVFFLVKHGFDQSERRN